MRYVQDGRSEIDNNLIENAVRPVALEKKRPVLGSENGGRRGGVVYPLRVSAGLQGPEPLAYLNDALSPIGTHPCKQPEESPPRNGKPAAKSKKLSPEIYSTRNIGFSPSTQNTKCQDGIARRLTNLNTFA